VPPPAGPVLALPAEQLRTVGDKATAPEHQPVTRHGTNGVGRRLATIPGVGPITATAPVATVGAPAFLTSARHFPAWPGPTPRQHASGGREWPGGIGKRGDGHLRRLPIHGARPRLPWRRHRAGAHQGWIEALPARRPGKVVTVALAGRTARGGDGPRQTLPSRHGRPRRFPACGGEPAA
jgi:transposase